MKRLYAPWRSSYIKSKNNQCPFCIAAVTDDDLSSFVCARYEQVAVILNRYPYNTGHMLIIPYQHESELSCLMPAVRAEMMEAVNDSITVLKKVLQCHGINVGFNFGESSGGSIPDHLHMHVVPRWSGDTNFLVTVGNTKLISCDLHQIYQQIKDGFEGLLTHR